MSTRVDGLPNFTTITVVLIDDHMLLADSVAAVLGGVAQIEILAIAGTCTEGLLEVRRHQPNVCLLDQRLPDGLGIDLVPKLLAVSPATKILLVTGDDTIHVLREAMRAGTLGVICKGQRATVLRDAVLRAAAGDLVLSPRDVLRLLPKEGNAPDRLGDNLTPREREILQLLVAAVRTADIAKQLFLSHATVRNNIQSILVKLDAHSKLEAVSIAIREQIVSAP